MLTMKNKSKKDNSPKKITKELEYTSLLNAAKKYEERIKEIEDSTYWKFYLFLTKTKLILTSDSYLKNDKWRFFQRIRFLISKTGMMLIKKFLEQIYNLIFGKINNIIKSNKELKNSDYENYKIKKFPRSNDLIQMKENIINYKKKPYFAILALINSSNFKFLNQFLSSLENQIYTKFNVYFIIEKEDEDEDELINFTINKISKNDEKYRVLDAQNFAPEKLNEDYFIYLNVNCMPTANCFYQFINEINLQENVEFIYSDNDFVNIDNIDITENPYFKPDWSPHTLLSRNYIGKLFLFSKTILQDIEWQFNNEYKLVLNLTKEANKISHISQILYHEFPEKINFDKILDNHNALNNYLFYNFNRAQAKLSEASLGCFEPLFNIENSPLISIIIPCRNKASILDDCLKSIFEKSLYTNFEIIIIDNGSDEKSFFTTLAKWEFTYPEKVKSIKINIPFNYSILNNQASKHANGDYLLFLNNDTELISENLFLELLQIAQLENIGVVGPKLLYPNKTLQHAGIVLALDDAGGHVFSGAHKDTAGYFNNTNCLTNYSAITGACMMIKKDRFEQVNGFDENLSVDCNDVDLCCELLEAGYYNVYVPWVNMLHHECLTRGNPILSKKSMKQQNIEKKYLIDKRNKLISNDPFYNINLSRHSKFFEIAND